MRWRVGVSLILWAAFGGCRGEKTPNQAPPVALDEVAVVIWEGDHHSPGGIDRSAHYELYLHALNGGDIIRLTCDYGWERHPSIGPDGQLWYLRGDPPASRSKHMLLSRSLLGGEVRPEPLPPSITDPDNFAFATHGGPLLAVETDAGVEVIDLERNAVIGLHEKCSYPDWSPTQPLLALSCEVPNPIPSPLAQKNPRRSLRIIRYPDKTLISDSDAWSGLDVSLSAYQPDWSPDGRLLVFPLGKTLYIANPQTATALALTEPPTRTAASIWTPDGTHIAFQRRVTVTDDKIDFDLDLLTLTPDDLALVPPAPPALTHPHTTRPLLAGPNEVRNQHIALIPRATFDALRSCEPLPPSP